MVTVINSDKSKYSQRKKADFLIDKFVKLCLLLLKQDISQFLPQKTTFSVFSSPFLVFQFSTFLVISAPDILVWRQPSGVSQVTDKEWPSSMEVNSKLANNFLQQSMELFQSPDQGRTEDIGGITINVIGFSIKQVSPFCTGILQMINKHTMEASVGRQSR